jgi:1-acyl-sn-glycerol-3-phosphate acyltransferase
MLMGSVSVVVSYFDPQGRRTDAIARFWARLLLAIAGARVRVRGLEHIDAARGCLLVGNHLSLYDTPVVLAHVPVRFRFLVAAKYVRMPFLGTHLRRCGHFEVESSDARASLRSMTRAASAIEKDGVSILMFPEGARALAEMGEFREGAAYIAIKAGVPVIPFAIHGTRGVLPIGSAHVKGGLVELAFGEPIVVEDYALRERARLTQVMFDRVAGLYADLVHQSISPSTATVPRPTARRPASPRA